MLSITHKTQSTHDHSPCFIMTVRKRTITLEQGLMRTWRFPRFSALLMLFRASARTFMRTMMPANTKRQVLDNWSNMLASTKRKYAVSGFISCSGAFNISVPFPSQSSQCTTDDRLNLSSNDLPHPSGWMRKVIFSVQVGSSSGKDTNWLRT